ncbi:DUF6069 family protein [Nocardioides sp. MH1]|uniref:DUF6069 family protein n=1 Tax=Nocardioides sp. MH1 TaxID=3242490 RepID=UPI00351FDF8F
MSTTTQVPVPTTTKPAAATRPVIWRHGVVVAVAAAATTTALAAVASAAGVSFADSTGASIPVGGFATTTIALVLIGVAIAAVMARVARRPRSTFTRTAVVLTALSLVPDATFGFDAASAITLMTLHVIAAAIVVPVLAGRLVSERAAR